MPRADLGLYGERAAARYLKTKGYAVVARRWRCRNGELDLVATYRGEVVFVEVKTRRGNRFGTGEDAVDRRKREKLRAAAFAYLDAHGLHGRPFRIDVIAVDVREDGTFLRHLRYAVGEG